MLSHSVLVVDAGTTAVKAALVDNTGRSLATSTAPLSVQHPGPDRAEQHPEDWWLAFRSAVLGCRSDRLRPAALAVTGQMQDLVPLDRHGRPVRPALLYSDLRAGRELGELRAALGPGWQRAVGNTPEAASSAAQLRWLRRHEPDTVAATHRLLFGAPGYLLHRCGGRPACDLTTASTTGLLQADRPRWWPPVLDQVDLATEQLPELVDGVSPVGQLRSDAATELGLPAGIPLVHAAGDAAAATAGTVGDRWDLPSVSLGTSGWVAVLTGRPDRPDESLHRLVGPTGRESLLIGALLSAGATLDWARATQLPHLAAREADAAAAEAGPSGLLMLPSLAGERCPVRDPLAAGAVVGIRPGTTPVQLYRAAMEGVGYALRRIIELMELDTSANHALPVSGGPVASPAFRRLLADVLDRPVAALGSTQAGLRGAQRAASAALGWPSPPPLVDELDPAAVVHPGPDAAQYRRLAAAHTELWTALGPTFRQLAPADPPT